MNRKTGRNLIFIVSILIAAVFLSLANGSVKIPLGNLFDDNNRPIIILRMLRILAAAIAGSGLSVAGIVFQAILRNPLAEPYVLGTSSGAGLGAVTAVITGAGVYFVPIYAFIGALGSIILVYSVAKAGSKVPVQSLILSGVIISVALSAILVFLVSFSSNEAIHGMMWWLWGSLEIYDIKLLFIVGVITVICIGISYIFSQDLNAISIGEEEAMHLGVDVEKTKVILLLLTSFLTASIVCVTGIIGFVGLVIPHFMRMIVGPNHKVLIPSSCVFGCAFLVLCDMLGRTVFSPIEIPIGVMTALIGAPVFIILLKNKEKIR